MPSLSRPLRALGLAAALTLGLFANACNDWPEWVQDIANQKPGSGAAPGGTKATGGTLGHDGGAGDPTACDYQGKLLPDGTQLSPDGCNTCYCKAGILSCTEKACPPPPPPPVCKSADGTELPEGALVSPDGTSSCICKGGTIVCAQDPRPAPTTCDFEGKILTDGDRVDRPNECKLCTCESGLISCTTSPSCLKK